MSTNQPTNQSLDTLSSGLDTAENKTVKKMIRKLVGDRERSGNGKSREEFKKHEDSVEMVESSQRN